MVKDDLVAYLADLAQRAKPATVRFYTSRLKWVGKAFGEMLIDKLTSRDVLAALDSANRRPDSRQKKAPDTIRANTIAWEQLQKWAIDTGRLDEPITKPIKKPTGRMRELLPTKEQISAILAETSAAWGRLYRLLLLTGARPDELCRATIADYKVAESIGDRQAGPLLTDDNGRAWTRERASNIFRRTRKKLGFDSQLVLYCTRHKAATELCHAAGIEAAAAVLGHAGLQTIRRYVHHETDQLVRYAQAAASELSVPQTPPAKAESAEPPTPVGDAA